MMDGKINISVSGNSHIQNFNTGRDVTVYSGNQIVHTDDAATGGHEVMGRRNEILHEVNEQQQKYNEKQRAVPSKNEISSEIVAKVAQYFNEPEDFLYDMGKKGFVFIVNNVEFDHLKKREGSDQDFESLRTFFLEKAMWSKEDFHCIRNRTVVQMKEAIKQLRRFDFTNNGAFFFIILSHGNKYGVCGTDSKPNDSINILNVEEDILPWFDANSCSSLIPKPKVFIIQACRGDMDDMGALIETDADLVEPPTRYRKMVPATSEYLLCYPCVPGYTSLRNIEHGSYFIQSLVKVFNEKYGKEDILKMLLRVNYSVSHANNNRRIKQMPSHDNRLTRQTFFHDYFVTVQRKLREKGVL